MTGEFWREFLRVNFDKSLLVGLFAYLHKIHAPDMLQSAVIGGLIALMTGQRFQRRDGKD